MLWFETTPHCYSLAPSFPQIFPLPTHSHEQLSVAWVKNKGVTPAQRAFSDCVSSSSVSVGGLIQEWMTVLGEERKLCDSERILFQVYLHAIHSIHPHTTPSNISRATLRLRGAKRLIILQKLFEYIEMFLKTFKAVLPNIFAKTMIGYMFSNTLWWIENSE